MTTNQIAAESCPHCRARLERGDDGKCNRCGKPWPEKQAKKEKHNRPYVVAIDLDGTLAEKQEPFDPETIGDPIPDTVQFIRECRNRGARVVVHTVRGDKDLVEEWLQRNEVPYDFVNENPYQPDDSSDKLHADVYVDDRAENAGDVTDPDSDEVRYRIYDEISKRNREYDPEDSDETPDPLRLTAIFKSVRLVFG